MNITGTPQAVSALALRQRAEANLQKKANLSPEELRALSPETTQAMLHEMQVHQIELELQNEELRRACFIWMVFTGVAASIRHADAARVTVLLNYFPKFVKNSALPIYVLCNLIFSTLTIWTGLYLVRQQVVMHEHIATLGVPSWTVGIVLPLSAALSIFSLIQSLKLHRNIIAVTEISMQE